MLFQGDRGLKGVQGEKGVKGQEGPPGEQVIFYNTGCCFCCNLCTHVHAYTKRVREMLLSLPFESLSVIDFNDCAFFCLAKIKPFL